MGAAMEEARRILYEKVIRKFTLQEVTKHKTIPYRNLIEMLTRYPGNGVGFKVYSKWWPQNTFYHVKEVELFNGRFGRLYGVKYADGQIAKNKVEQIKLCLKRGMWRYQLNDPQFTDQQVVLDNGVQYDLGKTQELLDEKREFLRERKRMMEYIKEPPVVEKKKKVVAKKAVSKTPAKAAAGGAAKGGAAAAKKK